MRVIERLLDWLGFEIVDATPPVLRSWFKKASARAKEILTRKEVQERLVKIERAMELVALDTHQANVDKAQAEGAAALLKALDQIPDAVLQIGSLAIVKRTDSGIPRVVARTLTQEELLIFKKTANILQDPSAMMKLLAPDSPEGA
jgi:hypothetical protein